ncbi:GNAT family N-acetyltransferase [Ramlibacter albus]|uniref:GNAT family N-acetyltransferase n=1 Tax=Ramlibacter albus TaxID=2079448 RepID=A0A923M386_9BURK|nr:GNAT family N-acetyltransferase [Ramlibacter albus]MBC5763347.1 GNAT family N-acetyltransferase [Ramlibacter albus]
MQLVTPAPGYLAAYTDALRRGWSPDNARGAAAAAEQLEAIERDAQAFVAGLTDREALGAPIRLPDGSTVPRLPGFVMWMWDGEFCGSIGMRWQRGTEALPPYCLGHIGYGVVPWKRERGYAKAALAQMLVHAKAEGLRWVDITTDLENRASQRVILANGGVLLEQFEKPSQYAGSHVGLRYRVELTPACA